MSYNTNMRCWNDYHVCHNSQYCTVLYCTVLYCTVLYCTVLYCTVLYCTVLYCTVLYCTVLYCTVLYCNVLYSMLLYCIQLYDSKPNIKGGHIVVPSPYILHHNSDIKHSVNHSSRTIFKSFLDIFWDPVKTFWKSSKNYLILGQLSVIKNH